MILSRLSIVNFKNIAQADLSFSPNINCFLGNNGMGKSNLLDAIYYLSFCKSYTRNPDSQNIRHGEDFFVVQGYYERNGNEEELYCGIKRRQKKAFKRNKKEYDRLSDHIGFAPLVMAAPSDNELILGGSEERRKFIDLVISQFDKQYLSTLIRYNKALEQRNALLRQECSEEMLYDIWEEQMDSTAAQIHNSRDRFLQSFIPVFRRFYNEISSQNESADLIYKSHLSEGALLPQLKANRHKDLILGYTSRGIHRDDMDMMLGEYPMKRIGSQGQCKTYLIALKLAQYDFLREQGDTTPILLLDDIFDKLDAERVKQIVKLVSSDHFGQIFITDTNRKYLDEIIHFIGAQYNIFSVDRGEVKILEGKTLPIGDIISQFISEKNFGQKLDETQVMRLWPRIAGETVNSYTQSMYVHNRTLYVRLSSAVLRNELTMLRNELLTRINAEFGHRVIDNIIFR